MRCLGLTKDFRRCKNSTKFLVCRRHLFQFLLLLVITIPTVIVNLNSIYSIYNRIAKPQKFFAASIGGGIVSISKVSESRPGALLYFYDSGLGLTPAPVNVAIYVEVVNLKPSLVRLSNYSAKALIEYKQNGHAIEQVAPLHSLPLFNNVVVFLHDDLSQSSKWTMPSLDALAVSSQLRQGESLRGWMLFEMDRNFRDYDYKVKKIILTLENNAHDIETVSLPYKKDSEDNALLSGGVVRPERFDITKLRFTLAPLQDLQQMMRQNK